MTKDIKVSGVVLLHVVCYKCGVARLLRKLQRYFTAGSWRVTHCRFRHSSTTGAVHSSDELGCWNSAVNLSYVCAYSWSTHLQFCKVSC